MPEQVLPVPLLQGHLFSDAAPPYSGERFDTLVRLGKLHIERIVSAAGVVSSTCVQPQDEWMLLVQGEAVLDVDGAVHALTPGDHVFLPAGVPHQVLSTSQGAMWVAVHVHP
jgi:cupin 2 domain-containing protein